MDVNFSKIKNLVKQNGDKFILVENGEAELVVMSFKEYERLSRGPEGAPMAGVGGFVPKVREVRDDFPSGNFDDLEETEFVPPARSDAQKFLMRLEDIRLEDLPV